MQLARDPRLLLGDRAPRGLLPLALQALGARLELGEVGATRAQVVAQRPRRGEDRVHGDDEYRLRHAAPATAGTTSASAVAPAAATASLRSQCAATV